MTRERAVEISTAMLCQFIAAAGGQITVSDIQLAAMPLDLNIRETADGQVVATVTPGKPKIVAAPASALDKIKAAIPLNGRGH